MGKTLLMYFAIVAQYNGKDMAWRHLTELYAQDTARVKV